MGTKIEGIVDQIRASIREDAIFEPKDLEKILTPKPSLAHRRETATALDQVLVEMFMGKFQTKGCFRLSSYVLPELRQLIPDGLPEQTVQKAERYIAAKQCLEQPFDPATIKEVQEETQRLLVEFDIRKRDYQASKSSADRLKIVALQERLVGIQSNLDAHATSAALAMLDQQESVINELRQKVRAAIAEAAALNAPLFTLSSDVKAFSKLLADFLYMGNAQQIEDLLRDGVHESDIQDLATRSHWFNPSRSDYSFDRDVLRGLLQIADERGLEYAKYLFSFLHEVERHRPPLRSLSHEYIAFSSLDLWKKLELRFAFAVVLPSSPKEFAPKLSQPNDFSRSFPEVIRLSRYDASNKELIMATGAPHNSTAVCQYTIEISKVRFFPISSHAGGKIEIVRWQTPRDPSLEGGGKDVDELREMRHHRIIKNDGEIVLLEMTGRPPTTLLLAYQRYQRKDDEGTRAWTTEKSLLCHIEEWLSIFGRLRGQPHFYMTGTIIPNQRSPILEQLP